MYCDFMRMKMLIQCLFHIKLLIVLALFIALPAIDAVQLLTKWQYNQVIRPLGAYERLLSRTIPNKNILALSHASAYLLDGIIADETLNAAVTNCMHTHPILRSYIADIDGSKHWVMCDGSSASLTSSVLRSFTTHEDDFEKTWREVYTHSLNNASFQPGSPQWMLTHVKAASNRRSAWVFTVNHGCDDQQSVNIIVQDLIRYCNEHNEQNTLKTFVPGQESTANAKVNNKFNRNDMNDKNDKSDNENKHIQFTYPFPVSIETAIASDFPRLSTILWALYQVKNSLSFPTMVPYKLKADLRNNKKKQYIDPNHRTTFCEYFDLRADVLQSLILYSKRHNITLTNLLSAAMLVVSNYLIQEFDSGESLVQAVKTTATAEKPLEKEGEIADQQVVVERSLAPHKRYSPVNLRFLLSVGLRKFASSSYIQQQLEQKEAQQRDQLQNMETQVRSIDDVEAQQQQQPQRPTMDLKSDFTGGTVACTGGAVDFNVALDTDAVVRTIAYLNALPRYYNANDDDDDDSSTTTAIDSVNSRLFLETFNNIAQFCKREANHLINSYQFVPESVRLFDIGFKFVDILQAVELDANNKNGYGRGFTCGVSNVGVVELPPISNPNVIEYQKSMSRSSGSSSSSDSSKNSITNDISNNNNDDDDVSKVRSVSVIQGYYGTSHHRNGVLCELSLMTLKSNATNNNNNNSSSSSSSSSSIGSSVNRLCGCLQFTNPLVSKADAVLFTDKLTALLLNISKHSV